MIRIVKLLFYTLRFLGIRSGIAHRYGNLLVLRLGGGGRILLFYYVMLLF
jgi:hypothetical protein